MKDKFYKSLEEHMANISQYKESYIRAWIAETGLLPSQCLILQENIGTKTKMWVERKPDEPKIDIRADNLQKWLDSLNDIESFVIQTRKKLLELEFKQGNEDKPSITDTGIGVKK